MCPALALKPRLARGFFSSRLFLQAILELLAELGDFGCDDGLAVRLVRVTREILLMIILGRVKLARRRNLRHDGIRPKARLIEPRDNVLGLRLQETRPALVPLTLGGGEVTVMDMTYAFSVLANMGVMAGQPVPPEDQRPGYRTLDPVAILRITDGDGQVLYQLDAPHTIGTEACRGLGSCDSNLSKIAEYSTAVCRLSNCIGSMAIKIR